MSRTACHRKSAGNWTTESWEGVTWDRLGSFAEVGSRVFFAVVGMEVEERMGRGVWGAGRSNRNPRPSLPRPVSPRSSSHPTHADLPSATEQ